MAGGTKTEAVASTPAQDTGTSQADAWCCPVQEGRPGRQRGPLASTASRLALLISGIHQPRTASPGWKAAERVGCWQIHRHTQTTATVERHRRPQTTSAAVVIRLLQALDRL
jgi:hypothetical protein